MAENDPPASSPQVGKPAEKTGWVRGDAQFDQARDRLGDMALHSVRGPVGRVAAAVTEIESLILRRDVAARYGEPGPVVADLERQAVLVACVALDEGVEFLDSQLPRLEQALGSTNIPLTAIYQAAQKVTELDVMPRTGPANGAAADVGKGGMSDAIGARSRPSRRRR
jgi:hypothetical protein